MVDLDVTGRRVFVRVDFNVPLADGVVQDDTRIRATLPTLHYALSRSAKLVLGTHLGRPRGERVPEMSLRPVAKQLAKQLAREVRFCGESIGEKVEEEVKLLPEGGVLLLENLRFDSGEELNDATFARRLAASSELYVNDAFGTAHRAHASTVGMVKHFPKTAAAGLLMERELLYLDMALASRSKPFVVLLGGAKISDKIDVVRSLLDRVDYLLIGGGMAYTFLRAKGYDTGSSLVEENKIDLAKELLAEAGDKLVLPSDHVVASRFDTATERKPLPITEVPKGWMGLDIGPKTIATYRDYILGAKMVIWNGPMGVFEMEPFAQGTVQIAKIVAESEATSLVGGGDSVAAVVHAGVADHITHISTGGGASLKFLAGEMLPGVEVLTNA